MKHTELTGQIIDAALRIHSTLGNGYPEAIYQRALVYELHKRGLAVALNRRFDVIYDGIRLGTFVPDMVVNDVVIVENKAVTHIAPAHEVQVVGYLTASGIDVGLLLNFGAESLEIRRKHRVYQPSTGTRQIKATTPRRKSRG